MTGVRGDLWSGADAYERYMGRWSRRIAPLFLDWLTVDKAAEWLDVGCGTGALSAAIIEGWGPARVLGVDPAAQLLAVATDHIADARFSVAVAGAEELPNRSQEFSAVVAGLVLNFVGDKAKAVTEMVRSTRPGGRVGLYVWDYAGHMQIMRHFFDAATQLDPMASRFDDGVNAPVCRPEPLVHLLTDAGLTDVAVTAIDIPAAFDDFDDYWAPFLGGTGSAPKYCSSLSATELERLRQAVRARLPSGPDGEILLAVRAWAVKGTVAA